jgi:branched-subunit amino acid ABC-type transport system permease component
VALVVVVFAPLMGLVLERLVFRHLRDAATSVKVVVTVGLLVALQGAAALIWGPESRFLPPLFPPGSVRVFGDVHLGLDQVVIMAVSLFTVLALGAMVRWTPFGLKVRASVDRPEMAELSGIDTARVSGISWALGFSTAALAGILLAPVLGLEAYVLTLFVIQAFAAALFARLESFALTLAGGFLIAFLEELSSAYLPNGCEVCLAVRPAVPFALIFAVMAIAALVPRSGLGRWVRRVTAERSAPPPSATPAPRRGSWVPGVVLAGGLALAGPFLEGRWLGRVEIGLAMAGVFASFVLLSGLSGQISLAHTAFVGTGAFTMGLFAQQLGLPFGLAMLLSGLAAVPVAIFVALPAIRLHGLHVALLTFGFGIVVTRIFESRLTGGTDGTVVPRPSLASSDHAYYYVLLVVAVAILVLARNLHRSPSGRVLAAIRDSEAGAAAIGVSIPLYRLAVFSLAAFLCGIAGAALGGLQGLVTFQQFHPILALVWLSVAVIGGMGSVWGAVAAAALWAFGSGEVGPWSQVGFGLGAVLLARNERGAVGMIAALAGRMRGLAPALGRVSAAYDGERPIDGEVAVARGS